MMSLFTNDSKDKLAAFVSKIDGYESSQFSKHEFQGDIFRVFARFISRSLDSRYLDRHPPHQLLPDLEDLLFHCRQRKKDETIVKLICLEEGESRRCLLMTCMPDQNFIYSVVRMGLDNLGIKTFRSFHSVVPVQRDEQGHIEAIGSLEAIRESFIWLEIDGSPIWQQQQKITDYFLNRLQSARIVVQDFSSICARVSDLANKCEQWAEQQPSYRIIHQDNGRLLRWLLNEHFVFLGMRFFAIGSTPAPDLFASLGVGRESDWRGLSIERPEEIFLKEVGEPPFLWIRKSQTESWIYRAGRTDHILLQHHDDNGCVIGLWLIEGIFSYQSLSEPRTQVPYLDRTIDHLYKELQATKGSHRYRAIRNAFNSLPLEYLFTLPPEDVKTLVERVLEVEIENRSQIHMTVDEKQAIAFVFVALPRSHYTDELRADLRRLLQDRFSASAVDDGIYAGNDNSITCHFFITGTKLLDVGSYDVLKQDIDQLASPWEDRLQDELHKHLPTNQARMLHAIYHDAFPRRYREETSITRAAEDIAFLEKIGTQNRFDCDLYSEKVDSKLGVTRLRMFQSEPILLSDILPMLDNFGLIVIDQFPTVVHAPGRDDQVIATFRLGGGQTYGSVELLSRRQRLCNAIRAVVLGYMSNDPMNRLLLAADIPWPAVVLIIAYQNYAKQLGFPFAVATIQEALLRHADIVKSLVEFFSAKFDPDIEGTSKVIVDERRLELVERSRRAILMQLDAVEDLTSDQILRTLFNLIEATVRTNYYARDLQSKVHLSLKFDPSLITRIPEPRPFREIYVYHPEVAGLHLRGGPVARGGIRWSDRYLDYRTEVFGLMVTQNLKNVLIVPRGAKGAFVLRHPSADLSARRAQADSVYRIFIRGLLDVTDNLEDGKITTPERVICYEGTDHYLVVAADKGTAHLSDTANQLAIESHFWLNDAFASGGSQGYDHKKEAITSRGAWACVKRHFWELGVDPEVDSIAVVGIGDMSGDVFGNGLLRSRSVQLIAAFDHRHIFIDPDPDAATSYALRKQLFEKPRSSWEDYPKNHISRGGGVYPRSAKMIKLSPEAQAALGILQEALSGPDLVQAILRAPVDLLWNGGIGTYIKGSHESHLDVGDPTNDNVRIDGLEVRARVIGEGGNLGITTAGRIELASNGVRLNTDAMDNSAGVDLSDHEVNLKILCKKALELDLLKADQRDALLEEIRQEIGIKVVHNNWLQSRTVSLDEIRSKRDLPRFQRATHLLSENVPFKKQHSGLPDEGGFRLRIQKGEGLYRPELSFLLANIKLYFKQELLRQRDSFPLETMKHYLLQYFPEVIQNYYQEAILQHPLAEDIARTMMTNVMIADLGSSFIPELVVMTGCETKEIIQQYLAASDLLQAYPLKALLDTAQDPIPAKKEYQLRLLIEDALESATLWLLQHPHLKVDELKNYLQPSSILLADILELPEMLQENIASFFDAATLQRFKILPYIDMVLDLTLVVYHSQQPIERVVTAFMLMGQKTGILHLLQQVFATSNASDELERPARLALKERLRQQHVELTLRLLKDEADLTNLSGSSQNCLENITKTLQSLAGGDPSVSHLVMAVEHINRQLS